MELSKEDHDVLKEYLSCHFTTWWDIDSKDDLFLESWQGILDKSQTNAAMAIQTSFVKEPYRKSFSRPEAIRLELYQSFAGVIPVVYVDEVQDFEELISQLLYKGKYSDDLHKMGASFLYGKQNRFLVLSNKPYSNVSAETMGLEEQVWKERSMILRREHECTHYFTKRHYHIAKNHIHDELIADFNGLMSAMNEYKASWFLNFMGIDEEGVLSENGRFHVYVKELPSSAIKIMCNLVMQCAKHMEVWSKSKECKEMSVVQRTKLLCKQDLVFLAEHGITI